MIATKVTTQHWKFILLSFCVIAISSGSPGKEKAGPNDEAEDEIRGATTPARLTFREKWDEWETWEAPEKIYNLAPYYKSGYDYDGLPIVIVKYGKWDNRVLAQLKPDEVKDLWKHHEQYVRRALTEGAANNNAGILLIADWDGFSLANLASGNFLKMALKACAYMTRLNDVIRYGYHINTNFGAEMFLNMGRPSLGNTPEKFEMYGTRRELWRPALLRKIPPSQLPPEYGGDKSWKPAPWNMQ